MKTIRVFVLLLTSAHVFTPADKCKERKCRFKGQGDNNSPGGQDAASVSPSGGCQLH